MIGGNMKESTHQEAICLLQMWQGNYIEQIIEGDMKGTTPVRSHLLAQNLTNQ